jgi:predicted phosphodiesterase
MLICAAGDVHGALSRLYEDVRAFEAFLGVRFDYILQVGDFGVWPDANRVDKATRNHDGAGNFPLWLNEKREVPRPTVFIKGNHEDFVWLDAQEDDQVLPGLTYLRNGQSVDLRDPRSGTIRVVGVGGCYGPSNYMRRSDELQGYARRHYTSDEIERAANTESVDIVLTHDAPGGVRFNRHRRGAGYTSDAQGLDVLLNQLRPKVCFFGHHHVRVDAEVAGVRCVGLNKVAMPGNLVAIEIEPGMCDWSLIGEYAGTPAGSCSNVRALCG